MNAINSWRVTVRKTRGKKSKMFYLIEIKIGNFDGLLFNLGEKLEILFSIPLVNVEWAGEETRNPKLFIKAIVSF